MLIFDGYQAPHDGTIPPHVLVTSIKPDIFIYSEESQEAVVFSRVHATL